MRKMLAACATAALLAAGAWGYGSSLPRESRGVHSAALAAPPERVWATLTDYQSFPEWRSGIDGVTSEAFGWIEHTSAGDRPIKIGAMDPPRQLLTRLDPDAGLGYSVARTYELEATVDGTKLTLTETREIDAPLSRLRSHINGPDDPAEVFLAELGTRLQEAP